MSVHPEIQSVLDILYNTDLPLIYTLTPTEAREFARNMSKLRVPPREINNVDVVDHQLTLPDATIPIRQYKPHQQKANAILVYYYGGGYVVGSIEERDYVCRTLATELGIEVFAVGYRLAPEHSFPTPIEDGYSALLWINENFCQDKKLIVSGDSAGAHLTILISFIARDNNGPEINLQYLFYPWIDTDLSRSSYQTYHKGFALDYDAVIYFMKHFLAGNHQAAYPPFPLHFKDFTNLPPTYLAAARNDVLIDEIEHYVDVLKKANNQVEYRCFDNLIHGFVHLYNLNVCYSAFLSTIKDVEKLIK